MGGGAPLSADGPAPAAAAAAASAESADASMTDAAARSSAAAASSPALPPIVARAASVSAAASAAPAPPTALLNRSASVNTPAVSSSSAAASSSSAAPAAAAPAAAHFGWSGLRGAGFVLGALSAAKAGMKLAPAVIDGGLSLAQSGTDNFVFYSRRGVELGTGAVRSGVTYAGDAAALHLERLAAESVDESTQSKYASWARNTKRTAHLVDRGLEKGSDLVEHHVLGTVKKIAGTGLGVAAYSVKHSIRTTNMILKVAETGTRLALRGAGYDLNELSADESDHEKLVDCLLRIIDQLKALNAQLTQVGTAEMIKTLMTYARLVETVEADNLFRNRRPVLTEYLASITEARKQQQLRAEQDAKICVSALHKPPRGSVTDLDGVHVCDRTQQTSAPVPAPAKRSRVAGWFGGWWGSSKDEEPEPAAPAPVLATDPAPSTSERYEDGLYMLAGGGMKTVSRAMLFAGCAYGPRFMRFLGVPTSQTTHEGFIVEQCGIAPEDLLQSDFTSSLQRPGFFLALDHASKQVMLVIRGSSALHDALTDLTCSFTRHVAGEFGSKGHAEGSCHEGMLKSAQWFAANLRQPILEALRANPGYNLVLSGHSLGGGVGSLLALLWLHDAEMNPPLPAARRMQGFFFGSPCVVSAELAHLGYGYVWNFVLGHDVVCRLSKGAVEDLCGVVLALTVQSREANELLQLPSKARRVERAKREAAHAKEAEAAAAAGKTPLHPASQDYTELAKLLDKYHALQERLKKEGPDAPLLSAAEAAAAAAAQPASIVEVSPAAASSSSSSSASAAVASPVTLRTSVAAALSELTSILLQLRKGMVHEKLFPLGHIFHLIPKGDGDPLAPADEAAGAEEEEQSQQQTEDRREKAEEKFLVDAVKAAADPSLMPTAAIVGASSSAAAASSSSSSASSAAARRKTVQVSRAHRLCEIIGAPSELVEIEADGTIAGSDAAASAAAASASAAGSSSGSGGKRSRAGSLVASAKAGLGSMSLPASSGDAMVDAAHLSGKLSRAASSTAERFRGSASKDASREASPARPAPAAAPVLAKRPSLPIARPVSLSRPESLSRPGSIVGGHAGDKRPASEALDASSSSAAPAAAASSSSSAAPAASADGDTAMLSSPVYPSLSRNNSVQPPAMDDESELGQAYAPPLAAPVPATPRPAPEPTVFTHPAPYSIVAGHWSDLTDLVLSSSMLQHHLPQAYFAALATHETTRNQASDGQLSEQDAAAME